MLDILLNPNLAYLFLVGGFSLSLLAILTPGTGLLEISAVILLLLAGWGVYSLPINYWALAVLIIGVFPFFLALRRSRQLIYLGISVLALVIGSAFLFRGEFWWQPAVNPFLALVVSLLAGGFFWIVARKALEADSVTPSHDLGVLIGAVGEAKTEVYHEGSVQVLGELWTARSRASIPSGAMVRVIGREGLILEVEQVDE
jgi:membrane-bound serine protease (ClpP class)